MFKLKLLFELVLYYLIFMFFVYFISDHVMFPIPERGYNDKTLNVIKITSRNGKKISVLYLKNETSKYTILLSHGNYEDLGTLMPFLEALKDHGFSVFAYDYQGYGTSEGSPSEKKTYEDISAAYDYMIHDLNIPADHIILYGRSVGTGPTVDLASRVPIAGVILQSPMLTAFRILTWIPLFPIDKYRNNAKIKKIHAPILIIHGTKDEVIPYWHGKHLYELANEPKYFYPVDNAQHNDLLNVSGETFWQKIIEFEKKL